MRRFKNLRIARHFLCATLAPAVRGPQMMSLVSLLIPRFLDSFSSTHSVQILVDQRPGFHISTTGWMATQFSPLILEHEDELPKMSLVGRRH